MSKNKILLTALSAVLATAILAACTPATAPATTPTGESTAAGTVNTTPTTPATGSPQSATPEAPAVNSATTPYSAAEIAAHNSPTDCWVAASGQVYDITDFLAKHKSPLDQYCGQTTEFEAAYTAQHGNSKTDILAGYQIGVLQ